MNAEPDRTAPLFDPIDAALAALHDSLLGDDRGEVATYIPELADADPRHFGLALVSTDGDVHHAGDAEVPFTIQSVSKPFVYALALEEHGLDAVLARVGAEPSGEAFNAISLDPQTGRPDNPMINAGAILTTSLITARDGDARFARIRRVLCAFAGRELGFDQSVFASEAATGDRNRALAHLMRSAGALTIDVDDAVDTYFRQCSVLVTTVDLAVMAATLAAAGRNPITGEQVVSEEIAEQVVSVMATCGMYDASGEWLLRVGLPAKSGVSGGILAVSPAQFGLGVSSPRLGPRGNSVRGVEVCHALSSRFSLHLAHRLPPSRPIVTEVRDPERVDGDDTDEVRVTLRGDLEFATAERVLRALDGPRGRWYAAGRGQLVFDVAQVTAAHPVAVAMLDRLADDLAAHGVTVAVHDPAGRGLLPAVIRG